MKLLDRLTGGFHQAAAQWKRTEPVIEEVVADIAVVENSAQIVQSSDMHVMDLFGTAATSGKVVNEHTAMRVSMAFACSRLICGALASLPFHFYQRTKNGKERFDTPLWYLFNEAPTPRFTAAVFWEYIAKSQLFHGDGFATMRRNAANIVVEVIPHHPLDVVVERRGNRLVYFVQDNGVRFGVDQDDMLHFPSFGFDGLRSLSVIQYAAKQNIGFTLTTDEFRGKLMSQGLHTPFFFHAPGKMTAEKRQMLRSEYETRYQGYQNTGRPMVLTEGVDLKTISMSMADAQLIEQMKMSDADIARAFGVPGHMVNLTEKTTSWGSGIESLGIGFVTYTLLPYMNRDKQEINRKLFKTDKYFGEFLVDALQRGDQKSRSDYFKAALGGTQAPGWMTPNDVRRLENLPPIDGGDHLYTPVGTTDQGTNNDTPPKSD